MKFILKPLEGTYFWTKKHKLPPHLPKRRNKHINSTYDLTFRRVWWVHIYRNWNYWTFPLRCRVLLKFPFFSSFFYSKCKYELIEEIGRPTNEYFPLFWHIFNTDSSKQIRLSYQCTWLMSTNAFDARKAQWVSTWIKYPCINMMKYCLLWYFKSCITHVLSLIKAEWRNKWEFLCAMHWTSKFGGGAFLSPTQVL